METCGRLRPQVSSHGNSFSTPLALHSVGQVMQGWAGEVVLRHMKAGRLIGAEHWPSSEVGWRCECSRGQTRDGESRDAGWLFKC
jgi:hypothetical protein